MDHIDPSDNGEQLILTRLPFSDRDRPDRDLKRPTYFSAIWISLIVIFICALTPVEAAQTRWVGSAFDPSTTSVALKGRSNQELRVDKAVRAGAKDREGPSDHAASSGLLPALLPLLLTLPLIAPGRAPRRARPAHARVAAGAPCSTRQARAPPFV